MGEVIDLNPQPELPLPEEEATRSHVFKLVNGIYSRLSKGLVATDYNIFPSIEIPLNEGSVSMAANRVHGESQMVNYDVTITTPGRDKINLLIENNEDNPVTRRPKIVTGSPDSQNVAFLNPESEEFHNTTGRVPVGPKETSNLINLFTAIEDDLAKTDTDTKLITFPDIKLPEPTVEAPAPDPQEYTGPHRGSRA
ncbi:hypothetical protein A3F37_00365 [Candidatus Saccharibacteria bacterium RIFCSPHIGHO2_12_FULL_41_12]|nr:MAG: hypothetical protein A3F37_00365 [Candidatus Saccharibacteria bacterium RIFCSPHIGHO2_12_FULL_41_12]